MVQDQQSVLPSVLLVVLALQRQEEILVLLQVQQRVSILLALVLGLAEVLKHFLGVGLVHAVSLETL